MSSDLSKGISAKGGSHNGKSWNILGSIYYPKAVCESTFAFEINHQPGQSVPVHIHPYQDKFILVQEGILDLKLDGDWIRVHAGDIVRVPRRTPHGYQNKSDKSARSLFWVSPSGKLEALFDALHNLGNEEEVIRISALHDVIFPAQENE